MMYIIDTFARFELAKSLILFSVVTLPIMPFSENFLDSSFFVDVVVVIRFGRVCLGRWCERSGWWSGWWSGRCEWSE